MTVMSVFHALVQLVRASTWTFKFKKMSMPRLSLKPVYCIHIRPVLRRPISVASNAIQTIDNKITQLINYIYGSILTSVLLSIV